MEHVQKVLQKMDASLKNLETDLQNSKVPQGEHDQFYAVMGVSFSPSLYSFRIIILKFRGPCTFGCLQLFQWPEGHAEWEMQ